VAGHQVPAQAVGRQQRALEVHRGADRQRAEGGQGQRLVRHVGVPALGVPLDHGEAAAADGDGFAQSDVTGRQPAPADAQALVAAADLAGQQAADGLDQASEHGGEPGKGPPL
jgi:hypothetical protein